MTRKVTLAETAADDITAGRPERYYECVYKTYGKGLRSGSIEGKHSASSTAKCHPRERTQHDPLYREILPTAPAGARRQILLDFLAERSAMRSRSPDENARRKELLSPKKTVG